MEKRISESRKNVIDKIVSARKEKSVHCRLKFQGVQNFLPIHQVTFYQFSKYLKILISVSNFRSDVHTD